MSGPRRDASGDRIGALYDRCAASLFRYAAMILADPAGAADAVQEVFLKLAKSGSDPEYDERYLRRAVRNECYSMLRRQRRERVVAVDPQLLEAIQAAEDRPAERLAIDRRCGDCRRSSASSCI
jgi:RNA polymerase sigma factor (sigma-70 family)